LNLISDGRVKRIINIKLVHKKIRILSRNKKKEVIIARIHARIMILNHFFPDFNSSGVNFFINKPKGNPESAITVKMIIVGMFILMVN
jgi:hypothetical protein